MRRRGRGRRRAVGRALQDRRQATCEHRPCAAAGQPGRTGVGVGGGVRSRIGAGHARGRRHAAAGNTAARNGRARVAEAARLALEHRAQFDDAGHLERVERLRLVGDARQVDDDVLALDADVGLGDAEALELVAHQVADDDQFVLVGRLGSGVDDREATFEVETENRRAPERNRQPEQDADGQRETQHRRPEALVAHCLSGSSSASSVGGGVDGLLARRTTLDRRRRRLTDPALDRRLGDADLDVLVDLEPELVVFLARDEPVDPGRRDDFVADVDRRHHRRLLTLTLALRADQYEVHHRRNGEQKNQATQGSFLQSQDPLPGSAIDTCGGQA